MTAARRVAWIALAFAAAAPATATAASGWIEEPRALSVHLVERERGGDVIAVFAAPLEAPAPVRITAQISRAGSEVPVATSRVTWRGGWLTASWPSSLALPGHAYDVLLCPAAASCAAPVRLVAPSPSTREPVHRPGAAPLAAAVSLLLAYLLARRTRLRRATRFA